MTNDINCGKIFIITTIVIATESCSSNNWLRIINMDNEFLDLFLYEIKCFYKMHIWTYFQIITDYTISFVLNIFFR